MWHFLEVYGLCYVFSTKVRDVELNGNFLLVVIIQLSDI